MPTKTKALFFPKVTSNSTLQAIADDIKLAALYSSCDHKVSPNAYLDDNGCDRILSPADIVEEIFFGSYDYADLIRKAIKKECNIHAVYGNEAAGEAVFYFIGNYDVVKKLLLNLKKKHPNDWIDKQ